MVSTERQAGGDVTLKLGLLSHVKELLLMHAQRRGVSPPTYPS